MRALSLGIFLAVLGAAFLHALWNALIKLGTSKVGGMVILSIVEVPIGLTVVMLSEAIDPAAVPWVLAAGILLMARGVFASGENRRLLPFAIGSACATATYTLIDGMGARVSGSPAAYVAWVFVADGCFFTLGMLALRGWNVIPRNWHAWRTGAFASAASYGAYAVSIWAMTFAPIAVVAALRETSILFAVLIGWLVFGERMTGEKALASVIIVAGVILTRL